MDEKKTENSLEEHDQEKSVAVFATTQKGLGRAEAVVCQTQAYDTWVAEGTDWFLRRIYSLMTFVLRGKAIAVL